MASQSRIWAWQGAGPFEATASCQARAGIIGLTARELLVDARCAGQVLAVVSGAVYLRTDGGEVLWLTPVRHGREGATRHGRGVACEYDGRALRSGMAFDSRDGLLRIESVLALDLRDAVGWSPHLVTAAGAAPRELARERAACLARSLPPPGGEESRSAGFDELARGVAQACLAHDTARVLLQCQGLVGLGPGLTPAGDDFVGGLLFAAWHLQRVYPGCVRWDGSAVDSLLRSARTETNVISHCILRDLARGNGPESLHDLTFALLAADEDSGVMKHVSRMRQLGSSTGREMLAGALTGILLLSDPVT